MRVNVALLAMSVMGAVVAAPSEDRRESVGLVKRIAPLLAAIPSALTAAASLFTGSRMGTIWSRS